MANSRINCNQLGVKAPEVLCEIDLGEAMTIRDVGALLGCSAWTVRQRYLPLGLPYFRVGNSGKFVFFRRQVTAWILNKQQQQKGGNIR